MRIHAGRVELAGKIDVSTEKVASLGAPSGGGIWITSEGKLSVEPTTQFLAKGGNSATDFGNGNGGGGRIALGQRLPAVKVAELAEDGELPVGCSVFELDDFLEVFPEVTVSLEGGHADNKPEDPPMEGCCGTFRYIIGPAPATVLMFK